MKRSNRQQPPALDVEVVELFQDEPQLLAIADAVAATQRRRSRRSLRLPSLAAAVAAVAILALFLVIGDRSSLVDDALAAVGSGRILHTVILSEVEREQIVDVRSGRTRPLEVRVEAWSDDETGRLRVRTSRDGGVVTDALATTDGLDFERVGLDPTARFFVTGYRSALRSGDAREADSDVLVFDGQQLSTRVDLGETAKPVRFRSIGAAESTSSSWRVLDIRGEALVTGTFDVPERGDYATGGNVVRQSGVAVIEASRALGGAAVWSGRRVAGLALRRIEAHVLERQLSRGGTARRNGLEVSYGNPSRFVLVRQATRPDPAYGYVEGRYTFSFAPIPSPGEAAVSAPSAQDARGSSRAQLRFGGVFLTVLASSRDLLLDAIRALRPIA